MAMLVSGVAKRKDGTGLGGVTVKISSTSLPEGRTTITQPDGSFQFSGLPEGKYEGTATGSGISRGGSITFNEAFDPVKLSDAVETLNATLTHLNDSLGREMSADGTKVDRSKEASREVRERGTDNHETVPEEADAVAGRVGGSAEPPPSLSAAKSAGMSSAAQDLAKLRATMDYNHPAREGGTFNNEGSPEEVDATARRMGFAVKQEFDLGLALGQTIGRIGIFLSAFLSK